MIDPSLVALVCTAACTLVAGSRNHINTLLHDKHHDDDSNDDSQDDDDEDDFSLLSQEINLRMATMLPFVASASLVVMYLLVSSVLQFIVTAYIIIVSIVAVYAVSMPLARTALLYRPSTRTKSRVRHLASRLGTLFTSFVVMGWLYTGSWLLNNVIGVSLCITIISSLRLPSLKVASVVAWALFFYDVFWVFESHRFFGESVMVKVASATHSNPVNDVAQRLNLPLHAIQTLQMPLKLIFPSILDRAAEGHSYILGLGDIGLPGILASFMWLQDLELSVGKGKHISGSDRSWPSLTSYFGISVIGYVLGLASAVGFSIAFKTAQPALLYIVPCMMVPVVLVAKSRGELGSLWAPPASRLLGDKQRYRSVQTSTNLENV